MKIYELLNPQKEYLKGKKALVFDMDGTLIDSMQYWCIAGGEEITKYPSLIEFMYEKYNNVIEPKPYALELLELLHKNGIPVCIASDTPRKLAEGFFKRYDLDAVTDFYIGSDDVGCYKSVSPKIYLHAAEKLGVKPEECVVFEDNRTSVLSALKSGMTVVGIFDKENAMHEEEIKGICTDYIYSLKEMLK